MKNFLLVIFLCIGCIFFSSCDDVWYHSKEFSMVMLDSSQTGGVVSICYKGKEYLFVKFGTSGGMIDTGDSCGVYSSPH